MNEEKDVIAALNRWLEGIINQDIGLLETLCHPDIIIANDEKATASGIAAIREKYELRFAQFDIKPTFEVEHVSVYGKFAFVVGRSDAALTLKNTGEKTLTSTRLALNYLKNADNEWKVVLEINNNE